MTFGTSGDKLRKLTMPNVTCPQTKEVVFVITRFDMTRSKPRHSCPVGLGSQNFHLSTTQNFDLLNFYRILTFLQFYVHYLSLITVEKW